MSRRSITFYDAVTRRGGRPTDPGWGGCLILIGLPVLVLIVASPFLQTLTVLGVCIWAGFLIYRGFTTPSGRPQQIANEPPVLSKAPLLTNREREQLPLVTNRDRELLALVAKGRVSGGPVFWCGPLVWSIDAAASKAGCSSRWLSMQLRRGLIATGYPATLTPTGLAVMQRSTGDRKQSPESDVV